MTSDVLMPGQLCVVLSALARYLYGNPQDDLVTACDAAGAALDLRLSLAQRKQIATAATEAVHIDASGEPDRLLADWLKEQRVLGRRHALRDALLRARRTIEEAGSAALLGAR